jgi:hypothetical protein
MATLQTLHAVFSHGKRRFSVKVSGDTINFRDLTSSRTGVKIDTVFEKPAQKLLAALQAAVEKASFDGPVAKASKPAAAKKAKATAKPTAAKKPGRKPKTSADASAN